MPHTSKSKLNWGIIGTGAIARAFAHGLQLSETGRLLAVASRTKEGAEGFGEEFSVARRYASYPELLKDRDVGAVYIATPHPWHGDWSIRAAEAGKHILCEKPAALNLGDTMVAIEHARRAGVFWMEAFMYRCHPQTIQLVELIRQGAIGELRALQATFSFRVGGHLESRLLNRELGGGGILDVGCYPVSLARLLAGVSCGLPFDEPNRVDAAGHVGEKSRVDEWSAAVLRFPGDFVAQVACGVEVTQDNTARIYGTKGWIHLPAPWQPAKMGGKWSFKIHRPDQEPETISGHEPRSLYTVEADYVAEHLERRQASSPGMSWQDTLGNMRVLDLWRQRLGVAYPSELPETNAPSLKNTSSQEPRIDRPIPADRIEGLDLPVSRLVMGVDNQINFPHAAAMFDDYLEKGGHTFDSAWLYGAGKCESLLGHWIKNRGVRDQVVILDKGCHPPFCHPKHLTDQLIESLERLRTDYVDIYLLHRDNLDIPTGEFIDVLNQNVREGRIRIFGASNWTTRRVDEANRYAQANNLQGFAVLSNNFSLARWNEPMWDGCETSSDPATRAWLARTQMPNFAWSSQARGFFTDRAGLDRTEDPELVRCWYNPDNFKRRERAFELARRYGVLPINIALAYVLCQPFPSFALIGPRTLDETRTSLPSLDVRLTPDDIRYLELDD